VKEAWLGRDCHFGPLDLSLCAAHSPFPASAHVCRHRGPLGGLSLSHSFSPDHYARDPPGQPVRPTRGNFAQPPSQRLARPPRGSARQTRRPNVRLRDSLDLLTELGVLKRCDAASSPSHSSRRTRCPCNPRHFRRR
jgi:hypothetical protein